MATSYTRTAGIDISKENLDVARWPEQGKVKRHANNLKKARTLIKRLQNDAVDLVVVEATGGYECHVLTACHELGVSIHLAQPIRVRKFAEGHGTKAKTDAVDAGVLALYGAQARNIHPVEAPSQGQEAMDAIRKRLAQLIKTRTCESNRLEKLKFRGGEADAVIAEEMKQSIADLDAKILRYEEQLEAVVMADPELKAKVATLESQHGVGRRSSVALIVGLPELGKVNRRRIASLLGVACFAKDSGSRSGKRTTRGGRAWVRSTLFMANLSHTRQGSPLKPRYDALVARGKPKLVAQVAVLRQFVIRLNTLMKEHYTAIETAAQASQHAAAAGHANGGK